MIRIEAQTPPPAFAFARSNGASFSAISGVPAIRRALWDEQNGRCAYCERVLKLVEGRPVHTRIEHFHPQHLDPNDGTDAAICRDVVGTTDLLTADTAWSNLLLCCDGDEGNGPAGFHCDVRKRNTHICTSFRNPKTSSLERHLLVDVTGEVSPAPGLPPGAADVVCDVLGLNVRQLVRARNRVFAAYIRQIKEMKARKPYGLTNAQRQSLKTQIAKASASRDFPSTRLAAADRLG